MNPINHLLERDSNSYYFSIKTIGSKLAKPHAFLNAFPFEDNVLALPVENLDDASKWYSDHFAMSEVERTQGENPTVILERDNTRIGFSINGGDPTQDGAAILVRGIKELRDELTDRGVETGNWRVDENDGKKFQVFFVLAPDGLCYYFHEPLE